MTISIVIPVFNVKPYLDRCISSVLRQTYKDLEIIIVDDGSTDGSSELCDTLATLDGRITVVHQENQGLSSARNAGIIRATGEYVMFLDSDDAWLLDNGLELLMASCKPGSDLIVFKNVDFWSYGRKTHAKNYDVELLNQLTDVQAMFSHLVRTQSLRISACFVVVKRKILIDNNLLFYKGIISEDLTWSLHLWQHIQTAIIVNLDFYGYYHRKNSITTSVSNTLYAYNCYDKIFSYWKDQCEQDCVNAEAIRTYLADIWVSRGCCYSMLQESEKPAALRILGNHANLLTWAKTKKSIWTAKLVSIVGVKITISMLGLYRRMRMNINRHEI